MAFRALYPSPNNSLSRYSGPPANPSSRPGWWALERETAEQLTEPLWPTPVATFLGRLVETEVNTPGLTHA